MCFSSVWQTLCCFRYSLVWHIFFWQSSLNGFSANQWVCSWKNTAMSITYGHLVGGGVSNFTHLSWTVSSVILHFECGLLCFHMWSDKWQLMREKKGRSPHSPPLLFRTPSYMMMQPFHGRLVYLCVDFVSCGRCCGDFLSVHSCFISLWLFLSLCCHIVCFCLLVVVLNLFCLFFCLLT